MDKKLDNFNELDYTIVLDPRYTGLDIKKAEETDAPAAEEPVIEKPMKDEIANPLESLYAEYEAMCLKEPTILDLDDAYPHSYQWRVGDRYDPAKIKVLNAALKEGKRITDTEAYQEYLEDVKNRRFEPVSWE